MAYFDNIDYISNSDLTDLQDVMSNKPEKNLQAAYSFGHLIDAHITEPQKIQHHSRQVVSDGKILDFDEEKWNRGLAMKAAGEADSSLRLFMEISDKQKEVYNDAFLIEYEGYSFRLPTRIKMDFYHEPSFSGADLKTTDCTDYKSFLTAIEFFDYDRQGAWYMDNANLDSFMIIGISKKSVRGKHRVLKHAIQRGDRMFLSGKDKYSRLAFFYRYLIHNLNI